MAMIHDKMTKVFNINEYFYNKITNRDDKWRELNTARSNCKAFITENQYIKKAIDHEKPLLPNEYRGIIHVV